VATRSDVQSYRFCCLRISLDVACILDLVRRVEAENGQDYIGTEVVEDMLRALGPLREAARAWNSSRRSRGRCAAGGDGLRKASIFRPAHEA
jgi:hypothetical protein